MKHQRSHIASGIDTALQHHRAGRLQQAEALCKKMLHNPDALHLRGVIAHQLQKHGEAIELINQAIRVNPSNAGYYFSIDPAYRAVNRLNEVIAAYQNLLSHTPRNALAHNNLGNAFKDCCRLHDAEASYQQAIALEPRFAEAHANLGVLFTTQRRTDLAITCFQTAIALKPHFAGAHNDLGIAFSTAGQIDQAAASFQNAVTIDPGFSVAHHNLGCALRDQGKLNAAIACYKKSLALRPNFVDAHNDLGITYALSGNLDDAIGCYRAALALQPDYAAAYNNLGTALHDKGKPDEAIALYREALTHHPGFAPAHTALLLEMQYSSVYTPEEVHAEHVCFAAQFEAPLKAHWGTHPNPRDPRKRLKIGYVSPDFKRHAVSYSIEPVLALHDKSQVEIFCYYNHNQYDPVTERLQALADHWIPCKHLSDDQLAAQIRADGIDILIDLAGHTGGNRLLTFARKPAPVQATYLGYPATTGLTAIDYRITDVHAEPPGMTEQLNVEQLWRLPDIFCCYRAHDNSPDVIDHPPADDNGHVTFGCFNNFAKVTDPVLVLWARLLEKVPTAHLLLEIHGIDNPERRAEIEGRLARLGLPLDRVILVPRKPENQYVLYNYIDIALDPFPCNGGTTSLDTVWMGVPFVTLAGRHFTSRMGVTILTNAGLSELIAQTEEEYVDIAAALALDPARLNAIRSGLRGRVQASPLMDAQRFTMHLEQAYRGMWQAWSDSKHMAPDDAASHNDAGNTLKEQGRLDEAVACYREALALDPNFAVAYYNLGAALQLQDNPDEAVICYQEALALKPDFAQAYNNLGLAFADQGKLDDAEACYRQALALEPEFAEVHANLGSVYRDLYRLNDAVTASLNAIALKPNFPEAFNNLGLIFADMDNPGSAMECYHTALALRPDFFQAHNNLGNALKDQGMLDEALNCYKQALLLKPDYVTAHDSLLLTLQYSASYTPEEMFAEHVAFAAQFEAPLKAHWGTHPNPRDPRKRLKIGYVSPDFKRHAVSYSIEPVLALHDKSQVEIFCYYNGIRQDEVTLRLQALADHWIPCKHLSDDQLAAQIRADGIDILIDLAGHTGGNRLLTFARKPAPVQATYLGYPATTGLTAIDYRITDVHTEPPGMTEQLNVEQLWRLPDIFCCYRAHDNSPDVIDHPPADDNGHVTFGCFNNFAKVTDPVLALWARLLEKVPTAHLLLEIHGLDNPVVRAEVEGRLARLGLPLDRVILIPRKPENQYVLYNYIDIALDPFPCNGGTTSLDTVWMGVPFVTLAGRHFTSRMGVTILTNAGLPELIAQTEEEYVDIAAALALDPARLNAIRSGLRGRVQASPLMDAPRFTTHLEQAYRAIWQQWCRA